MKRLVVLAGLAMALTGAAACTSTTPGTGFAGTPTTTAGQSAGNGTTGGGSTASSTSGSGGSNLASLDPCSLLNSSEATGVGLPATGQPDQLGSARSCDWAGRPYVLIIAIRTDGGLADLSNSTPTQVGSHQARKQDQSDGCTIALAVTNSSRVDVNVTANTQAQQCPEAQAVAQVIEPKLPTS